MAAVARALRARRACAAARSRSRCASSRCSRRRSRRRSRSRAPRATSRRRRCGCPARSRGRSAATCRERPLDARLEVAARNVDRAGDATLGPLVDLADVDEERRVGRGEKLARANCIDFVDLRAQLGEQFAVRRHRSEHGTGVIAGYARAVASGRVVGIVALCAAAAVVAIVGGTVLLSRHESTTLPGAVTTPRSGTPVLQLEFGLRRDAEAQALARAQTLLYRTARRRRRRRSSSATAPSRRSSAARSRSGRGRGALRR